MAYIDVRRQDNKVLSRYSAKDFDNYGIHITQINGFLTGDEYYTVNVDEKYTVHLVKFKVIAQCSDINETFLDYIIDDDIQPDICTQPDDDYLVVAFSHEKDARCLRDLLEEHYQRSKIQETDDPRIVIVDSTTSVVNKAIEKAIARQRKE